MILGCLLVALCGDRGYCDEQEYRLTRYLMSNYDPAVRPSENASLPLSVKIQVLLQKIQQLVSIASIFSKGSCSTDAPDLHSQRAAILLPWSELLASLNFVSRICFSLAREVEDHIPRQFLTCFDDHETHGIYKRRLNT